MKWSTMILIDYVCTEKCWTVAWSVFFHNMSANRFVKPLSMGVSRNEFSSFILKLVDGGLEIFLEFLFKDYFWSFNQNIWTLKINLKQVVGALMPMWTTMDGHQCPSMTINDHQINIYIYMFIWWSLMLNWWELMTIHCCPHGHQCATTPSKLFFKTQIFSIEASEIISNNILQKYFQPSIYKLQYKNIELISRYPHR